MSCSDNSFAGIEHIAIFILGFVIIAVVVTAVVAQNSMREVSGQAYLKSDSFGGNVSSNTANAVNVTNAMTSPSIGLGIIGLLVIAALGIIAAIGIVASKG